MADDLMDKVVEDYNDMMREVDNKHPWWYKARKKLAANKRYGFQIMDEQGKVTDEYTIILADEPYIHSYEFGIKDVCLTKAVKASVLEEFFENEQDFINKPFRTALKSFKYLFNGGVTLRKKK